MGRIKREQPIIPQSEGGRLSKKVKGGHYAIADISRNTYWKES